jgi:hypothetical protein
MTYICTDMQRDSAKFTKNNNIRMVSHSSICERLRTRERERERERDKQEKKKSRQKTAHAALEYRVTFRLLLPNSNQDAFVNIFT